MSLPPAFHESLPYIDPEPTPEALAAARALIAAEQTTFPPPAQAQSLGGGQQPSFTPTIQAELDRVAAKEALHPLDLSRYEAREAPGPDAGADALRAVLEGARVSDAYLASRRQNLELLDRYGKNAWLVGNHLLEADLKALEAELADARRDIDLVNIERQRRQEAVRGEMHTLEDTWRKGVGRVLETEAAVEELKQQIRDQMKNRS